MTAKETVDLYGKWTQTVHDDVMNRSLSDFCMDAERLYR